MVLGAFSLWTVIPFGWIWIGSKVSTIAGPFGGPYVVVFVGIVISISTWSWSCRWLNRLYERLIGSTQLHPALPAGLEEEPERRARKVPYGLVGAGDRHPHLGALAGVAMAVWFFIAAGSLHPVGSQ